MKTAVLIGDGMGDYRLKSLGDKTPLETASIPNIRMIAGSGKAFLVNTIPAGMQPGSDVANLSIMGFDPRSFYTGRAPIEAAGAGIKLDASDTAFRCNLVTVRNGIIEDHSAGDIRTDEAAPLIDMLNEKLGTSEIRFYKGTGYRQLLVWKNAPLEAETTPPHDVLGQPAGNNIPRGNGSDQILKLMDRSRDLLATHPLNLERAESGLNPVTQIWLWGQGRRAELPDYRETRGLSGGVVSAVDLVRGIGLLAGLQAPRIKGATGFLDTDYNAKVEAAKKILAHNDFVFVHIEAPDECSHRGDPELKIKAIEAFDTNIVGPVWEYMESLKKPYRIVVGTDHRTPVATRCHTSEPVPMAVFEGPAQNLKVRGEFHEFINNSAVNGMAFELITKILHKV